MRYKRWLNTFQEKTYQASQRKTGVDEPTHALPELQTRTSLLDYTENKNIVRDIRTLECMYCQAGTTLEDSKFPEQLKFH